MLQYVGAFVFMTVVVLVSRSSLKTPSLPENKTESQPVAKKRSKVEKRQKKVQESKDIAEKVRKQLASTNSSVPKFHSQDNSTTMDSVTIADISPAETLPKQESATESHKVEEKEVSIEDDSEWTTVTKRGETSIAALQRKICKLEEELQDVRVSYSLINKVNDDTVSKVTLSEAALKAKSQLVEALEKENSVLKTQIADESHKFWATFDDSTKYKAKFDEAMQKLAVSDEIHAEELAMMSQKVSTLESQLAKNVAYSTTLTEELENLKIKLEEMKQELNASAKACATQANIISEKEAQIGCLENETKLQLSSVKAEYEAQIKELNERLTAKELIAETAEANEDAINSLKSVHAEEMAALKTEFESTIKQIKSEVPLREICESEKSTEGLKTQLNYNKQYIQKLTEVIKQKTAETETVKESLMNCEKLLADSKNEIASLYSTIEANINSISAEEQEESCDQPACESSVIIEEVFEDSAIEQKYTEKVYSFEAKDMLAEDESRLLIGDLVSDLK